MTQIQLSLGVGADTARHARTTPELPGRIGRWEPVALAAEGSLAKIYRARAAGSPVDLPPAYALKMLREEWQDDARAIGMLAREAQVGRSVSHPHLVSVLSASVGRSPRFLVMPWLDGRTLEDETASGRQMDLPEGLWIARQAAEALDALHVAGWMHGDVKPGNLMVSPEGHLTLLDLGFARRGGAGGSAVDRCVLGTCSYIAPELITSTLRADIRSDIYSLGVVLFELFSGRLPFTGDSLAELAQQHKQATPPNLYRLAPHLTIDVVRLIQQMLAKEPLRRPQTPRDLIDRLAVLEIATFSERAW